MIAALIRWSARNVFLIGLVTSSPTPPASTRSARPARRHARPLRHAGHRLHGVFRPGAAGDRGPGHLSAVDGDAVGAEIEGRPRLLVLRRLVRLRHLRGRHRHLLGALARARKSAPPRGACPAGVTPTLGPDATGVGWVYQYVVMARRTTLAELRTIQDWISPLRWPRPKAWPRSRASAASSGSMRRRRSAPPEGFGIPLVEDPRAIRDSNMDVGGRMVEVAETEFVVRGRGYMRGIADLEQSS